MGHCEQGLLLVLHVSLYRLDEVRDFVVPLLEQHVDVGPGAVVVIPQTYQFVVDDDGVDKNAGNDQEEQQARENAHELLQRDL